MDDQGVWFVGIAALGFGVILGGLGLVVILLIEGTLP